MRNAIGKDIVKRTLTLLLLALAGFGPLFVNLSCSNNTPTAATNFLNPVQTIVVLNPSLTPTFTFTPTSTFTNTPTGTPTPTFTPYLAANPWTGFNAPSGVAVDAAGNVYVADTGNNHVGKYSPSGALVATWGSGGVKGKIPFAGPVGVALDPALNLYVVGSGNQVSQYNASGGLMTSAFSASLTFSSPQGVATDGSFDVYVCDNGNQRIVQLNSSGVATGFGGSGILNLAAPVTHGSVTITSPVTLAGIAYWGSMIFVATQGTGVNNSPYSSVLGFDTATGNSMTVAIPGFVNPTGVAFDNQGNLYVADTVNKQFEEFANGSWSQVPLVIDGSGFLQKPKGIAVDSAYNIYVADSGANEVFKFAP